MLQWTLDINGMENFVYMNWVNVKNQNSFCFVIFSRATLNETLTAKNNDILREQNPKFIPLSETTSIPDHSIWEFPPRELSQK